MQLKKLFSILLALCMVLGLLPLTAAAAESVDYLDADGTQQTATACTPLTAGDTSLSSGWYAVTEDIILTTRLSVSGTVNLILTDGKTLQAKAGVNVPGSATLKIWAQSAGDQMGTLKASATANNAGIGGSKNGSTGVIEIYGGRIESTGDLGGAGIGSGSQSGVNPQGKSGGTVKISGGVVNATSPTGGQSDPGAAGIGGGYSGNGGTVVITGGTVVATGGQGAGIGGGNGGEGGSITITGGNVKATGNRGSAGIGGGRLRPGGTIVISGGAVRASGAETAIGAGTIYEGTDTTDITIGTAVRIVEPAGGSLRDGKYIVNENGDKATAAYIGNPYTVTVPGMLAHGSVTADKPYAEAGETVQLTVTNEDTYSYRVTAADENGDPVAISDEWTFTMPAAAVTVTAVENPRFGYVDENGEDKEVSAVPLTGTETELPGGWYAVNENVTFTHDVLVTGNVNLILTDGKALTFGGDHSRLKSNTYYDEWDPTPPSTFNIYAQTGNTGRLEKAYVSMSNTDFGIYGGVFTTDPHFYWNVHDYNVRRCDADIDYVFASGTVTIDDGVYHGRGFHGSAGIIINGGDVAMVHNGYSSDLPMYSEKGDIIINGGTVRAIGLGYYNSDAKIGIQAKKNTVLGYTNNTDSITCSGFFNSEGGVVKVKDGQTLTDGENVYSGTLTAEQVAAITGKTLRPCAEDEIHTVTVPTDVPHGTVAADKVRTVAGATVTLTVTPETGYGINRLRYGYFSGNVNHMFNDFTADEENLTYSFVMPDHDVFIDCAFGQQHTITVDFGAGHEAAAQSYADKSGYTVDGTRVSMPVAADTGWDAEQAVFDDLYRNVWNDQPWGYIIDNGQKLYYTQQLGAQPLAQYADRAALSEDVYAFEQAELTDDAAVRYLLWEQPLADDTVQVSFEAPAVGAQITARYVSSGIQQTDPYPNVTVTGAASLSATWPSWYGAYDADNDSLGGFATGTVPWNTDYYTVIYLRPAFGYYIADPNAVISVTGAKTVWYPGMDGEAIKVVAAVTTPVGDPCTVTFETDGGSNIASQTVNAGEKASRPDNPVKDGFIFMGWYLLTDDGLSESPFDFENTAVTADVTIKAVWEIDPDRAAADAAADLIDAIGEVAYTAESKDKIEAARDAYDALTDAQKALVDNYNVLTAAETLYAELEAAAQQAEADRAAAEAVEAKINAIGEVAYTAESKAKIDAARDAYNALTDAQKALVDNFSVLEAAEARYTQLKAAAETPDTPSQQDQPSGSGVCKWCGENHSGFWGSIVGFWHTIFYFWAHLFGLR